MKKIILLLLSLFIIAAFSVTISLNIFASEKELIEKSLEFLEKKDYSMAIDLLDQAILSIREKATLELKNLQFTKEEAEGFGLYQPREDISFNQGETFFIYAEPKNYTIRDIGQNQYEIHFKEDIYILDMEGNILWGQKDFLDYHIFSSAPNREIFITNMITQDTPFPQGEYQFQIVLKDVFSQKTVEETISFIVK